MPGHQRCRPGAQEWGKPILSPEAGYIGNPDIVFHICMLSDYLNIMTSYTFETKSSKVPVPKTV